MDQIITMASDVLLAAGALGAAVYCVVLARRLKKFNNLENGVGGAVAVLSAQVDDMTRTLEQARKAAQQSATTLTELTERAEQSARKLELMMAALHDLPEAPKPPASAPAAEVELDTAWETAAAEAAEEEPSPDAAPLFSTRRMQAAGGAG